MKYTEKRTHDKFYLGEDRYEKPKELFKLLLKHLKPKINEESLILDIGCATGDLLYYLKGQINNELIGTDIMDELLVKAKKNISETHFFKSDINSTSFIDTCNGIKADAIIMSGVLQIFDDFTLALDNILAISKPSASIFIPGVFNPHPIDVLIKYRESKNFQNTHFEQGWNLHSIESLSSYLLSKPEVKEVKFIPFEMPFDLEQKEDDLARTWTFKDENKNRLFTNGLSIIPCIGILEITL